MAAYEPTKTPVVSLYLNVDPTQRTTDGYKLRLRGLLKEATQEDVTKDLEAIERFFDHEYDWSGKSVVIFSNQTAGLWLTYSLAVPITQSRLEIGPKPSIRPLVRALDVYGSYGVVVVDRQGARMFDFHMGQLVETDGYLGEEIRKIKRGSGSSRGGASRSGGGGGGRHEREMAAQNLRDLADATTEFLEEQSFKHLLLAGTDETVAQLKDLLPKARTKRGGGNFCDRDDGQRTRGAGKISRNCPRKRRTARSRTGGSCDHGGRQRR